MTLGTRPHGRWTSTRTTVLGLVIAALAMLAILPLHQDADAGRVLIAAALPLITAGLVGRFGLRAHIWAAVLGFWLLLMNSWYTLANILGATDSLGILLTDALTALGGGITLLGAGRYLVARRHRGAMVAADPPLAFLPATAASGGDSRLLLYRALAGAAIAVQVLLLFRFLVMGLGWGGLWYVANLGQAVIFLALALALFWKRPLLVLPLPVVSLLLMQAFQAVDPSLRTRECTPAELSATAELRPPPGSPTPEFQSEPENGCIARFSSTLTGDQVLEHYRLAAKDAGWEVVDSGEAPMEPGQEPVTPGTGGLSLKKDQMIAELNVEPAGEDPPARDQSWVILSVSA